DLLSSFDVVICLETIEHILDDLILMRSMAACVKPGGRLLLTAPYALYRAISVGDMGPFSSIEDGGHVRRGYTTTMLEELCGHAGLKVESISFCSGYVSQKLAGAMRMLSGFNHLLAWGLVLPLRFLPPLLDSVITSVLKWPPYSICLEAYKPRQFP